MRQKKTNLETGNSGFFEQGKLFSTVVIEPNWFGTETCQAIFTS